MEIQELPLKMLLPHRYFKGRLPFCGRVSRIVPIVKDNFRVYCSTRICIISSRTRFLKYCVCAIKRKTIYSGYYSGRHRGHMNSL